MSDTLIKAVNNVRKMLRNPLPQAPSFGQIVNDLEAEYQLFTNRANNTQNAHLTDTLTVTTVAGTRAYKITESDGSFPAFYKAMQIVTVPADNEQDPEYTLEMVELEHYAQEWGWLGQNQGQLFSTSHDSQMAAIYRKISDVGEELWIELRPTPTEAQTYKILFHQGDWWSKVYDNGDVDFGLPFSEFKQYLYALVARNQALSNTRWCFDDQFNLMQSERVVAELNQRIERSEAVAKEHLSNLENHDIVEIDGWDDYYDI